MEYNEYRALGSPENQCDAKPIKQCESINPMSIPSINPFLNDPQLEKRCLEHIQKTGYGEVDDLAILGLRNPYSAWWLEMPGVRLHYRGDVPHLYEWLAGS